MRRIGIVAALLLLPTLASAGVKILNPIYLNVSGRYGGGSVADTRATADSVARVFVILQTTATYNAATVVLEDASMASAQCWTTNPQMVQTLASAKGDSYVWVHWDTSGQCTYVEVDHGSGYSPKVP